MTNKAQKEREQVPPHLYSTFQTRTPSQTSETFLQRLHLGAVDEGSVVEKKLSSPQTEATVQDQSLLVEPTGQHASALHRLIDDDNYEKRIGLLLILGILSYERSGICLEAVTVHTDDNLTLALPMSENEDSWHGNGEKPYEQEYHPGKTSHKGYGPQDEILRKMLVDMVLNPDIEEDMWYQAVGDLLVLEECRKAAMPPSLRYGREEEEWLRIFGNF
ncbi:uncharacterized protein LY89DRAFT_777092 [Mollisia scopiformis]|uniref:Uncharacterized protein n=1 Tax=Mollisia scopiformis TaxID=149040 RepID=A0A194XT47_MOLSC|nr:uncharacterized protein LY89DRAFT_777092 [Mollisia scopiformis]KUJ23321.1 hypothetical protein LY89DRAFT_777092 [Mollisia scopiformis]